VTGDASRLLADPEAVRAREWTPRWPIKLDGQRYAPGDVVPVDALPWELLCKLIDQRRVVPK